MWQASGVAVGRSGRVDPRLGRSDSMLSESETGRRIPNISQTFTNNFKGVSCRKSETPTPRESEAARQRELVETPERTPRTKQKSASLKKSPTVPSAVKGSGSTFGKRKTSPFN